MSNERIRKIEVVRNVRVDRGQHERLVPSQSDNFVADFNRDRRAIYQHLMELQRQIEILSVSILGEGTLATNQAELYVDEAQPGAVCLEAGYLAVIGTVVETPIILQQGFQVGVTNHCYLALDENGICSLRVDTKPIAVQDNEVWVGDVYPDGTVENGPTGKSVAGVMPGILTVEPTPMRTSLVDMVAELPTEDVVIPTEQRAVARP